MHNAQRIKDVFGNNVNIWILSPYAQNGYLQTDDGVDDYFCKEKQRIRNGLGTEFQNNVSKMIQNIEKKFHTREYCAN